MKDIDKMVDIILKLDEQDKMAVVFKILGSVMLGKDASHMRSTIDLNNGVLLEVVSELKLKE